ncbi:hypothetical protein CROQUDRAFT_131999 [Cronartium quercuum f. sp. fusiforme G11]|uniref:Uncharacterized protein n=1 Tax=Cronartium quercuum f. sp. fusiforme G11 TaxID=708437 RepID=A0A9P6NRM9_9BASI|nr:hypothetical protein CROQUDRAFT_131999 [Cronartium quercuum f. sp. fusiforme G11]
MRFSTRSITIFVMAFCLMLTNAQDSTETNKNLNTLSNSKSGGGKVGRDKTAGGGGGAIYDPEREQNILNRVANGLKSGGLTIPGNIVASAGGAPAVPPRFRRALHED